MLGVASRQKATSSLLLILSMWCVGEIIKWNHLPSLESPHSQLTHNAWEVKYENIANCNLLRYRSSTESAASNVLICIAASTKIFSYSSRATLSKGRNAKIRSNIRTNIIATQTYHRPPAIYDIILSTMEYIQRHLGGMQTIRRPQENFTRSNSIHKIIVRITALSTLTPG